MDLIRPKYDAGWLVSQRSAGVNSVTYRQFKFEFEGGLRFMERFEFKYFVDIIFFVAKF
jgi:hypothetical protein